jgi:hypothetical protein
MSLSRARVRWFVVVAFAVAMAWVEAASVYYLRVLVDRVNPYQANPLPMHGTLGQVELVREAATLVMIVAVGILAGQTRRARLGYAAIAFGVWDIFYYVFLGLIGDWPKSVFDWDILFLLPLPWWGPVLAPVCIAMLLIVGGTVASQSHVTRPATPITRTLWCLHGLGIALALYVFMADSLRAVMHGIDPATIALPTAFNWPVFCLAVMLMAAPFAPTRWRLRPQKARLPAEARSSLGRRGPLRPA